MVPSADTIPPVISGVLEASLLPTEATIVWATDELAVSTLEYGTSQNYGSQAAIGASALLVHTATLLNLTPGTTYYYCIHATDLTNNAAQSCPHAFTTAAAPAPSSDLVGTTSVVLDANPPTVSLITIAATGTSTITITWTTDEVANAEVEYGTTAGYGSVSDLDSNLALTHSVTLANLTPSTEYHYRIKSSDEVGNLAATTDETFTTNALPQVSVGLTAPEATSSGSLTNGSQNISVSVSSVVFSGIETASVGTSSVVIHWTTDLPSDSQVEYGDGVLFGSATTLDRALITDHSATITNLSPHTNYIFRVKSKPFGTSVATVSGNHEFNTLAGTVLASAPADVSNVQSPGITTSTAMIAWNTDVNATGEVQYGISTAYGEYAAPDANLSMSHAIVLSDLAPSTLYHYRVKSVNVAGDITYSEDYAFTTLSTGLAGPSPAGSQSSSGGTAVGVTAHIPTALSNITIASHDENSATLTWSVASAHADAAELYDIRYSTQPITANNFMDAVQDRTTPILYPDVSPSGAIRTYLVAGLQPNTTYYFGLKSKYETSDWSLLSNVVSVTTPPASSGPSSGSGGYYDRINAPIVTGAEGLDSQIVLNWKNPNTANFVRSMIVVKKNGGYPTSPQDGQIIYEGRGETFADANLTNGTTYYYALYSYDHAKNYSLPVHVSLAPKQGVYQEQLIEHPVIVSKTSVKHFVEVLKKGSHDIEVEHLQQLLAAGEGLYPEKLITGYFGTLTEQAVRRFQAQHNLPQTGITDGATQKELTAVSKAEFVLELPHDVELFERDVYYGQTGPAVEYLQKFLIYEGSYAEAIVSGYFGDYTRNAVIKFQKKYGVNPAVGFVGPKTRHAMRKITGF